MGIIIPKGITRERLVTKVTLLDPTARTMLTTNVTRFLSNMREKFPELNVKLLLTPLTSNIVKKNSLPSVTRNIMKLITVNRLLVMTHMLLIIILMDMDTTNKHVEGTPFDMVPKKTS